MSGVTSGIAVSPGLTQTFLSSSTTRLIKVSIRNESLVADDTKPASSSFKDDLAHIPSMLEDKTPAYLLCQLENKERESGASNRWLLVSYVPDNAAVRQKMLYASTRAALTRGLGDSHIADSLFLSSKSDIPAAILARLSPTSSSSSAAAPLSTHESELADIAAAERQHVEEQQRANAGRSHMNRVGVEWSEEAEAAVKALGEGSVESNLLVLAIDSSERLNLSSKKRITPSNLIGSLPPSEPCFAFYAYSPNTILFIYTCPSSSPVKQRMIYSSSLLTLTLHATKDLGVRIAKKIETSDLADLTPEFLRSELERSQAEQGQGQTGGEQKAFARPRGPGRKR